MKKAMGEHHIAHPYELYDLKMSKFVELHRDASLGKFQLREKIDGFRLGFIWDRHEARVFRSKRDLEEGGLTAAALEGRFSASHVDVEAISACNAINNAFKWDLMSVSPGTFNVDVATPKVSNVINYSRKTIVIHEEVTFSADTTTFNGVQGVEVNDWFITGPIIVKPNEWSNELAARYWNIIGSSIDIPFKAGCPGDPTLGAIVTKRLEQWLDENGLGGRGVNDLVKRLLNHGNGVPSLTNIKKAYPTSKHGILSTLVKSPSRAIRWARAPLENFSLDFSDAMLKNVDSALVIDAEIEKARLKLELLKMKARLMDDANLRSKYTDVMNNVRQVNAIEGVVFDYDNRLVKLTGSFANFNAVYGYWRHKR